MDTRRLEVFCKVVELKSFTKAGEALRLTQPTVSEHIRVLEESLDEKVVDRLGREVLPTPAGRVLYQYARNILQLCEEAAQALGRFRGDLAGHLTIGASTIPGAYFLPTAIASFKEANPAARITLKIAGSGAISEEVLERALEAGIVGATAKDKQLKHEEIFSDELVLVVPQGHPWAEKPKISLQDLEGEPFILREPGSGTRAVMFRALQERGFDPARITVVAEMGSTEAVRQGVKAGIGASALSWRAVAEDIQFGLLVEVKLDNVRFTRSLYLVQLKGRQPSPLCAAFVEHLRSRYRRLASSDDVDRGR
jgi:DNA-binding transcriptional LysR family regulator